jgi:hypothetical protein
MSKSSNRGAGGMARLPPQGRGGIAGAAAKARGRLRSAAFVVPKLAVVSGAADEAETLVLPKPFVAGLAGDPSRLGWHAVRGDAMAPTVGDGDVVVVALTEDPRDGSVPVVAAARDVDPRRVRSLATSGWALTCDNPAIGGREVMAVAPVVAVVLCRLGRSGESAPRAFGRGAPRGGRQGEA